MRSLPAVLVLCACSPRPITVELDGDSTGPTPGTDGAAETVGIDADDDGGVATRGPGPSDSTGAPGTTAAPGDTGDTGAIGCEPGGRGVSVLACGNVDLQTAIVADDAFVYAVIDGDIVRVPHEGGETEVLLPDASPHVLARHDDHLYWVQFGDGVLARLPVDAPAVEVLIEGMPQPNGIAMDEGFAYVTTYFDPGAVMRVPTTGGPGSVLYGFLQHPGAIVRHDAMLFFADSNNDGNDSTPILRGTIDGADLEVIDDADGIVAAMVVGGEQLVWALYRFGDSEIRSIALAPASTASTIATTEAQPLGLAVTDERAVWSEIADAGDHVALRSVSLDDGTVTDHLWNVTQVGNLVATPLGVVFTTPGALARLD